MSGMTIFVASAFVAGCATPKPSFDHVPIAEARRLPASYGAAMPSSAADTDIAEWWRRFGDPTLARLAERTLAANQDIAQAAARVAEARAGLRTAAGARLPTLGVSLEASRTLTRPAETQLDGSLDLGWDPDLFGGLASAHGAAKAELAAAGYDLAAVQRAAVAEVAANYVAYRSLSARIANAEAALAAQRELIGVLRHRAQSGIAVAADVEQARLLLLQVSALVPQLADARNQAANRIAVLIDAPPGALGDLLDAPATIPSAAAPPLGVPADLLRRRPDVLAAEQRVLAAAGEIGVAKAELYPHFSFGGVLSASGGSLPGLAQSLVASLIGGVGHALFDGGRARAAVAGRRAAATEAVAAYRAAVLDALEDVHNALSASRASAEWARIDRDAVAAAERNLALTRGRYELGLTDLFILLDAEQQLHDRRDDLLVAEAAQATAAIDLYVALGGGWEG
jgi:NodT family efflux transporter outer membrane factor (OMF) lipoprotein